MRIAGSILLTLILAPAGSIGATQDEEVILGKPSSIRPSAREQESLLLEAGTELRQQPRLNAPVLEILDADITLPVLERRGHWVKVRYGNSQGWVQPHGDRPPADQAWRVYLTPDDERLLHALDVLGADIEFRSLGPFTLYTDVGDEALLGWLTQVSWDVLRVYRERYSLDPGSEANEAIVLFVDEADYISFVSVESRIANAASGGYTSEGISALFTGELDRTTLVAVFIHELTHLLNRRLFAAETPPWLEEGMAQDLAFSEVTPQGQIRQGTLAGVPRQEVDDYAPNEPRAHVAALVAAWLTPKRPALEALVTMDWADFILPDNRDLHYAQSAMLLRYLLDGGEETLHQGFLRYLATVSQADVTTAGSLWDNLECTPRDIEEGLFRFLMNQARAYGLE